MMPSRPSSASLGISSAGKREASSHSMTWGAISDCAKSRTVRWSCCCSSVREKSTRVVPQGSRYAAHLIFTRLDALSETCGREGNHQPSKATVSSSTGVILNEVAAGQLSDRLFGPRGHGVEESLWIPQSEERFFGFASRRKSQSRFPEKTRSGRSAQN